ncbi:hypothetical protein BZG36_00619 [Bifiguratus adelaidae]|uniref:NIPSNAP domain-containing protein n=1 Tax=Bifiguratus adelaidae TaxID=1938954 RepID=A0A261Y7C0_9FUNG|nr:hypothetical protein BZG36_00619 [Bifiguratus adelaidae]
MDVAKSTKTIQAANLTTLGKLLHGEELTKEEQESFSKVLARGKYVHEFIQHDVKPDKVDEYIALISKMYPSIANDPENKVNLCGSWQIEIGMQDSFVHIWEYQGYVGHKETKERLKQNKAFQDYQKALLPLLRSRHNQIILEFSFWATSPPKVTNGIYELRTYRLQPGRLLEWETYWKVGLECRRKYCVPVGAWFSQLGDLNTVHHMWCYPDLQARKLTREEAWKEDGWAQTVYKTVRLIDTMQAQILSPLDFSPLR